MPSLLFPPDHIVTLVPVGKVAEKLNKVPAVTEWVDPAACEEEIDSGSSLGKLACAGCAPEIRTIRNEHKNEVSLAFAFTTPPKKRIQAL